MKTSIITVFLLLAPAAFADVETGKKLHDAQCMKCHDTGVYSRADRFIDSKDALTKQVERCNVNVGAQWFDDDVAAVVDYLNQTFYKFK